MDLGKKRGVEMTVEMKPTMIFEILLSSLNVNVDIRVCNWSLNFK